MMPDSESSPSLHAGASHAGASHAGASDGRFESNPDAPAIEGREASEEEPAPKRGDQLETSRASESPLEDVDEEIPIAPSSSPRGDYSIGEVADRVDLEAHVLRYWETEFPQLNPVKDAAGRRVYREADIRTVERIRHLLKEEKYTIAGARAVLDREGVHGRKAFRDELRDLRDFLVRLRDNV